MKEKVIYYSDLLEDDFSNTSINQKNIEADFVFINKHLIWRSIAFVVYYLIAFPLLSLFCFFYLHLRVKGRKVLRKLKKKSYFLYGNHTNYYDAFIHSILNFPKKAYVIANPDAVSIKGLGQIVMMLGALPIPQNIAGMKKFCDALKVRYDEGSCITIFPEAHIWPYYNKIRPFKDTSFAFPVKLQAPVVAMVMTYRQRRWPFSNRRPYPTLYFSDIFYPNPDLSSKEAQKVLRDQVYEWMNECLKEKGSYEYIRYLKKTSADE
ncbi:MAG: lysophospholipid acyltransferase family protein [Bacilli bacterium]|nr:lysophospholipid acyltransferase family protein [Bacilli bacterium]